MNSKGVVMAQFVDGAKSASRALVYLEIMVNATDYPVPLTEIARQTQSDVTTAYRTMRVLEQFGYVRHEADTRNYSLGPGLVALAARVMGRMDLQTAAATTMRMARQLTQETISLHIPSGMLRTCVAALESPHSIRRIVPLGDMVPIYEGPSGKVILAYLDDGERDAILENAVAAGRDPKKILAQLEQVREQGYLATIGDRTDKVGGLAIPVFDSNGIAAAFTVSGPADRWNMQSMTKAAAQLVPEVQALSLQLGDSRHLTV